MASLANFEAGLEAAHRLLTFSGQPEHSDRNEATTRLQLIDRLLFEALQWSKDDAVSEEYHSGEYADYVLGQPMRRLVVEAKREGAYFTLPDGLPRTPKLSTLFAASAEIREAIEQAMRYAAGRGTPFAAIANGHQLIAFVASRTDGVGPLDGQALAFGSPTELVEEFRLVWDNLSPPGVANYTLSATLGAETEPPPPPKLSSRLSGYPGFQKRGPLATDLQILGELFLHDLVDEEHVEDDFLRQCYSPSGALSQYAAVSKQILASRYSALLGEELEVTLDPAQSKKGTSDALQDGLAAASVSTRPIILLGHVGVGKTMFIRHLVRIDARELVDDALVLYTDLGSEPALGELEPFVTRHFIRELKGRYDIDIFARNFVRGVYNRDLEDFKDGIWGDLADKNPDLYKQKELEFLEGLIAEREAHLRRSLEHLTKARRKQVIIFLDNVDQREPEFQDRVFVLAQSLARNWPGTTFISLRPDTFNRSRSSGALSAYQPRVFTIPPPRLDRVIAKRITYGQEQIREHGRLPSFPEGVTVQAGNLNDYLDILRTSFRKNEQLMALLDNLSGGNVRRALEFVTTFVGSGHTRPERALDVYHARGGYVVPYFEFLRAILLGSNRYFDPDVAGIPNLFDISTNDGKEHFLLSILLSMLVRESGHHSTEGFVDVSAVVEFCQALSFTPGQIRFALNRAVRGNLVDRLPLEGAPERVRITSIGSYLCQELIHKFTYMDVVTSDTPILDEGTRGCIEDVRLLDERAQRCEIILDYLDTQWSSVELEGSGFDWPPHCQLLRREIGGFKAASPSEHRAAKAKHKDGSR